MFTPSSSLTRLRRRLRLAAAAVPAVLGFALLGSPTAHAKPIPSNLGNGLDKLVASNLAVASALKTGADTRGFVRAANNKLYTDEATAAVASSTIGDSAGRVLVRITLDGLKTAPDLKTALESSIGSVSVTAVDTKYRGVGVMNAYVDVDDVPRLASSPGVMAVILEWKPRHNRVMATTTTTPVAQGLADGPARPGRKQQVANLPYPTAGETLNKLGTTFDQGVTQHGIDQINKFYNGNAALDLEGQGMQVACISNSFNSYTAAPASIDVTNGDLPGGANDPAGNTTPVFIPTTNGVYQDDIATVGDDEGRAMCQIVHKMAPKAKIGFGTADFGEVGFANNIRALANLSGFGGTGQTFAADTICDDVGYFDEPFFQDGIIAGGITDVYNAGVSYFSSAANDIGTNGYDSDTRWVANGSGLTAAAGNSALAGTNIDLTNVPANLYAGGFHNFNPSGLDVAQTVNIATNNTVPTEFQWNDPYDQNTQATGTAQIFSGTGTFTTAAVNFTITTPVTAGTKYEFVEAATGGSGFDAIVTVYKSDGTTVLAGPQDTGTDETVRLSAPANDTGFVVKIDHYGTTTGTFSLNAYSYTGFSTPPVTTSLSVLVFTTAGAYIPASSLTTDATTTNQPQQLGYTNRPSGTQVQYVIARSVVPAAGFSYPTRIRYLLPGNGRAGYGPAEYFTYNTATTGGHAMSPGCNGCAAYSVFRPSLPETFTSPGPVMIYYDTNDNRLATPEVRLQPRVAFADGANVSANMSFFASDNTSDPDTTQGQFFGTSATGPHAAAIAALVLQNKGGPKTVTPAQMTNLLERSTFPHDLDPNFSSGSARVTGGTTGTGKIAITISSDGSAGSATAATGLGDTTSFTVSYVGGSSVTSLVFNPGGTASTAGNVTGGNNGVAYNAADATIGGTVTYFENSLPGTTFFPATKAFTPNTTLADSVTGLTAASAVGTNPNATDATRFFTETITIPSGNFPSSKKLRFTIGRGQAFAQTVTAGTTPGTVVSATTGAAYYSADIFGGGVLLPEGTVNASGMTFSGTTADGGKFSGTIVNNIGTGWSKTDGYGFVNAPTAVNQTVQ